jgi:hypothetical protein
MEPPEHRAESFEGEREGSCVYFCNCIDGYLYHRVAAPLQDGWAYTCHRRPICPGRARSREDGAQFRVVTPHICVPDRTAVAVHRQRQVILQAGMTCPMGMVAEVIAHQVTQ